MFSRVYRRSALRDTDNIPGGVSGNERAPGVASASRPGSGRAARGNGTQYDNFNTKGNYNPYKSLHRQDGHQETEVGLRWVTRLT